MNYVESYADFEEFKQNNPELNHQLWKNIVREQRWLTPMHGNIFSILSPVDNKLILAKPLSDYELYIINVLHIDYSLMINQTTANSNILAIDDATKTYYSEKSATQLAMRLGLNRKTIAKYINSNKKYNGFIFIRGDSYLDYKKA